MKKVLLCLFITLILISNVFAQGSNEQQKESTTYPEGEIVYWGTGNPKFRLDFYQPALARLGEKSKGVTIRSENMKSMADGAQKITMYALADDYRSVPDFIMLDTVSMLTLIEGNLLADMTDYYASVADHFIEGAAADATIKGQIYGLPDAVRPQLLFYNAEIFEKYDVDPSMMSTFEGYLEAGKLLKERSEGKVFLSYIDPGSYTWRYWFRRGLMPQAGARIWDEKGNIVIGSDPGTKKALEYFDSLNSEGLLYKTKMMSQPLYEATDEGTIATFYIGAFWDEFLRQNLTKTAGSWRVMNAPVFEDLGLGGAPVSSFFCIVDKNPSVYAGLIEDMWFDYQTNTKERNDWSTRMDEVKGPYNNPISKEMLDDPFWKEPSAFYGGQSFRKAESDGLINASKNLMVTASDGEADSVISSEIEKYVAGEQTISQALANMDKELKARIGKAQIL